MCKLQCRKRCDRETLEWTSVFSTSGDGSYWGSSQCFLQAVKLLVLMFVMQPQLLLKCAFLLVKYTYLKKNKLGSLGVKQMWMPLSPSLCRVLFPEQSTHAHIQHTDCHPRPRQTLLSCPHIMIAPLMRWASAVAAVVSSHSFFTQRLLLPPGCKLIYGL